MIWIMNYRMSPTEKAQWIAETLEHRRVLTENESRAKDGLPLIHTTGVSMMHYMPLPGEPGYEEVE